MCRNEAIYDQHHKKTGQKVFLSIPKELARRCVCVHIYVRF